MELIEAVLQGTLNAKFWILFWPGLLVTSLTVACILERREKREKTAILFVGVNSYLKRKGGM